MNEENIILCAVWCGPNKPAIHLLLEPSVNMLKDLHTIGIEMSTPAGKKVFKGKLIFGVFDMPAKAAVLSMKQFNGEYGCPTCFHPGKRLANGARVYLPSEEIQLRTHKSIVDSADLASELNAAVYGVKSLSLINSEIDLVKGIPVDYMHAVLEGMTKWLLHAWFDLTNNREAFYLGRYLKAIDQEKY
jgi:hypothetical protein